MAVNLSPFGGVGVQFFDNSGNPLTGGKIFTYTAGTTTPQTTYTTSAGATPHTNPIILDAGGRVPSGGEIWLTDGLQYKFLLKDANDVQIASYDNIVGINSNFVNFTNEQEIQTATAGQTVFTLTTAQYQPGTNSLSVFVDGVNQYGPGAQYAYVETDSTTVTFTNGLHVGAEVKFTTSQLNTSGAIDASQVSYDPPFTGAVVTNVEDKLAQTVSVKDFGAVGDGVVDDTTAIQNAINAVAVTGGEIYIPEGTYLLNGSAGADAFVNGIIVPNTGDTNTFGRHIVLRGAGKSTVLKAGSDNMFVLRFCDSQGVVEKLAIDGNNRTNVRGLGVCPANISSGTTITNVYYNTFAELNITSCTEGIYLQSGPTNGVLDSVTAFNRFRDINIYDCDRGIWLGGGFPGGSGSNRNQFQSIVVSAGSRGNTGVQIDDGDTNTFINVDCETITVGVSPNATPTCYYIAQTGNSGLDNNSNRFIGCVAESVVRTVDNNNQNTEFYSCVFPASTLLLTALPRIMIGDDVSATPQILPGYKYQGNTYIAGVPNGFLYPNKIQSANGYTFPAVAVPQADPNTLDDYEEGTWVATDASGAGLTLTVGGGMYVKVGQLVMAAISVTYPVTADASAAIIGDLPFNCQTNGGFNVFGGAITFTDSGLTIICNVSNGTNTVRFGKTDGNNVTNANLSGKVVRFCVTYRSTT